MASSHLPKPHPTPHHPTLAKLPRAATDPILNLPTSLFSWQVVNALAHTASQDPQRRRAMTVVN